MPKVNLPTINSGYLSTEALTAAFDAIEEAIDNTVSRDGSTPNTMDADLDMNGHRIVNVDSDPEDPDSIPTFGDVIDYVDGRASGLVMQRVETLTATAAQTVFEFTSLTYTVDANNLAVYVDGVRKFTPADYTETDSTTITFVSGLSAGQKVTVVTNDYMATVSLALHEHPWEQIINTPEYTQRWPEWHEVVNAPAVFPPADHLHEASDINSGRIADAQRGVYVQATEPVLGSGDAGAVWLW